MSSKVIVERPAGTLASLAAQVPPEAIVKAVDVIASVVIGSLQLGEERQRFERELAVLRQRDESYDQRLPHLLALVDKIALTDEARNKVVDTICELSLR